MSASSIIGSLQLFDSLTDVYGAQINGTVRTGYKQTDPSVGGSNDASGHTPESSVIMGATTLDTSQGAVTSSTDPDNLAIQGDGYFAVTAASNLSAAGTVNAGSTVLLTRDGSFHQDDTGRLVNNEGLVLVTPGAGAGLTGGAAVYDDSAPAIPGSAMKLSTYLQNTAGANLADVTAPQALQFSQYGSTIYNDINAGAHIGTATDGAVIDQNALEASNSSMTAAVPALNMAKNGYSAMTKVFQIMSENQDAVLNTVK